MTEMFQASSPDLLDVTLHHWHAEHFCIIDHAGSALLQVYDSSELGSKFMNFYRITSAIELPIILILDPITGAKQRQITGFVEPQRHVILPSSPGYMLSEQQISKSYPEFGHEMFVVAFGMAVHAHMHAHEEAKALDCGLDIFPLSLLMNIVNPGNDIVCCDICF